MGAMQNISQKLLLSIVISILPTLANADALSDIVNKEISIACDGNKGKIDQSGIVKRDFNGDGKKDILISHDAIKCSGSWSRSGFCGAQVCSSKIYISKGKRYIENSDILGKLITVSNDKIPILSFAFHGGTGLRFRWDGKQFSDY